MLSIVRSFARKVGHALRDRQIATRASPYADRPSVTSCAQTHTMKTVQVSRRGANKRTLIAGIALGAVVALSYVESAMAAWASCTGANGAELNTVNNPDTTGSTDACKCVEGYAEAVSTDSPTYVGGTTLNCKFCAEGYYLSSIGGEPADHVCSQVSDKVHTGPPTLDLTTYVSPQAPTSGSNDDCAADHYGVATGFDGTGCDACPFGGSSDAGSGDLVDCTPDCSDAAFAVDGSTGNCHCAAGYYGTADGTTTDGTGCDACPTATTSTAGAGADSECNIIVCEDIPLNGVTDATTGGAVESSGATNTGTADFSICETAPGYYLYSVASAATAAAGIRIEKAPEGWYAPGGEDVTDGNVLAVAEDALDETASGAGTQAYGDAQIFLCPTNSNSEAGSGDLEDCKCAANFYPSSDTCVACASDTTRAGTVSVTGTATCAADADSAGASTPIAVALAAAAAVPLLL